MGIYKKFWLILIAVLIVTFTILGYMGAEVYRSAPPIPKSVMSNDHQLEFKEADILTGQSHWQSIGGMQMGSIWGHGAYQAPDWTADWLHRELIAWLNLAAQETYSSSYDMLDPVKQAGLREMLKQEYRSNRLDDQGILSLTPRRAKAVQQTAAYYGALFSDAPELKKTRIAYAMKDNTLPDAKARKKMAYFFFWTSWAAATERAEGAVTYTNNWPHEPLIANKPSSENILWSMGSIVFLLAGIGLLILGWTALRKEDDVPPKAGKLDPITSFALTPSQQALGKYLFIVVALLIFQVFIGGFTAHYTVEGQEFYGVDVSQWFPYSLTRTWHIQSALFWIATGFLAAGLFLAPIINGGKDPAYQKLGVNILFIALLIVVTGSFLGQYSAIAHLIPTAFNFWFGHQGYEYIDLGRFWQIALFVGLLLWLGLMLRCMIPALKAKDSDKNLLALLTASVIAIGLFYGSGLFYGEHSNLSVMEYWRWWVVHLWVEGIFEVFATAALAYIFMSLGLVSRSVATTTSLA